MKLGFYQNENLLNFFAKEGADLDVKDNYGHAPLYYASQQKTGVMKKCLLKNKAHDEHISENAIERATSSILNNFAFPASTYDFEDDYNKFNEYVAEEEKNNKAAFFDDNKEQPHHLVTGGNYEVIYEDDSPFSIFMVKVEINRGYYSGNTFYRMQLLRDKIRGIIVLFTNWGRNGTDGQYQHTPFSSIEEGKSEFSKIFKSKSGNKWEDRENFQRVEKKYRLVTYKKQNVAKSYLKKINYKDPQLIPSTLETHIYKFFRRICNSKIITKNTHTINFDEETLPFHNLTKDRLDKAYEILNHIKEVIDAVDAKTNKEVKYDTETADLLTDLTNEYYTLIPTTNYKTTSIPPIYNRWELDRQLKVIQDLFYSEVVIRLLCGAQLRIKEVHPVDYCYNSLKFKILRVDKTEAEYQLIR